MERDLLERLQRRLSPAADGRRRLAALSSARSLVSNPDSSESTRCSVVDALVASLRHRADDPAFLRPALKLLADAASLSPALVPSVVAAVRPFLDGGGGGSLAADAVAALVSVVEAHVEGGDREVGLSLVASVLDSDRVLSLATSPIIAVRTQILDLLVRSVEKWRRGDIFGHRIMIQVFLGLGMDLYPLVRKRAVDGLIALLKEAGSVADHSLVDYCYERAVVLLKDEEEVVRSAAVKLISECGEIFAASQRGTEHSEQMDTIFVQLCSMARDMSMKIRLEAFISLGKIKLVHESVLLQSVSKKILGNKNGKALAGQSIKVIKTPLSSAAGAFVHGIEDEFYEVREVACRSLGMLTIFSVQFAHEATYLLMDMLNDDTEVVRSQTLQTLSHMATYDRLTMQDQHMQMFLGLLGDVSALIRRMARKLLQLVKLPDIATFRDTIGCLISNLETYPEEEEDIFLVLFFVGKNHKNFSTKLAKEFAKEIDLSCEGDLILDSHGVAAKLVLFISSSFPNGQCPTDIPMALFSYAVPFIGRMACALRGAISQDSLLAYLFAHSNYVDKSCSSSMPVRVAVSNITRKGNMLDLSELLTCSEQPQEKDGLWNEEIMQSIKLNLKTVGKTWPLIKSHCAHEVRNMLRFCKEELETIAWNADRSASAFIDFVSLYIQVVELIAEVWDKSQPKKSCIVGMTALDIILARLDMNLRRLRYGFPGLHREEECHILELTLLSYVFRLSKIGVSPQPILVRLTSTISHLEFLCEGPSDLSDFTKEVKHACAERMLAVVSDPSVFHKLLELFCPPKILFIGRFKQKRAEVLAIGNDSENPLKFVSGLPVGIPFHVTLYEVLDSDRLWLLMAVGESIQYVFLDLSQFEGCDAVRKCTFNAPFYGTPKAASFLLRVSVCMECPSEDVTNQKKSQGGPVDDFAIICEENNVHFVNVNNG